MKKLFEKYPIYKGFISTRCVLGVQKVQDSPHKNQTKINQRDSQVTCYQLPVTQYQVTSDPLLVTSSCPESQVPRFQDPRPQNGMVKLLPIPSSKKVRITKTKRPQILPQDSPQKSPSIRDMMLPNAHGPVPCYLRAFCPKKEIISWLCTSIASFQSPRPREKKGSSSPKESSSSPRKSSSSPKESSSSPRGSSSSPKESSPSRKESLSSPRESSSEKLSPKICKNCSRTLVSIGFVCYLLSCCVAFFNRECLGGTGKYPRGFSQGKRAWEHFS